jgi:hypothetical protein
MERREVVDTFEERVEGWKVGGYNIIYKGDWRGRKVGRIGRGNSKDGGRRKTLGDRARGEVMEEGS